MHKIVIAITGASGAIYPKLLLDKLFTIRDQWQELSIVMTKNAGVVWQTELDGNSFADYGIKIYDNTDFMAPFASGSARYDIMIIVPCSMGVLGRIAGGISSDLITRSADVILKERRKLILAVRETPYNLIHLQNMEKVTLAGGIVCPATPSFYSKPKTIEDAALTVVYRIIDLAGLQINTFRWGTN